MEVRNVRVVGITKDSAMAIILIVAIIAIVVIFCALLKKSTDEKKHMWDLLKQLVGNNRGLTSEKSKFSEEQNQSTDSKRSKNQEFIIKVLDKIECITRHLVRGRK